jgi:hypothetical protein
VDADRQDPRARLRGERRRAGRQRRPAIAQADRDPVVAVAPVHEQAEHLAAAEHAVDLAQVAPRDERHAPLGTLPAEVLEQLRERGVVGDHADRQPAPGDVRGDRLVAAEVADGQDQPAAGRAVVDPTELRFVGVEVAGEPVDLLGRQRGQPHEVDEIPPVLPERAEREPADARVVWRQPQHVPEVGVRPAPPLGRGEVRPTGQRAHDAMGQADRHDAQGTGRRAVGEDAGSFDGTGPGTGTSPVGRLEPSLARRHFAAVATLALLPASRRTVFLTGASVPTSVSSSSPRMNASTRLYAMSSWTWIGGLFMK